MKTNKSSTISSSTNSKNSSQIICSFCNDYVTTTTSLKTNVHATTPNSIDCSGYRGVVTFDGCNHQYHITCFIERYNITKETQCYCITKTKSNIPVTSGENINNFKEVMMLQNVEKTSVLSSDALQNIKRTIEELQRDKVVVNTTIGTNIMDNLSAKMESITSITGMYPDWTKMSSKITLLTHIKNIRTIDCIHKLKKDCHVNFNILFKKSITILDLVQSFGDKLRHEFIDALIYLEIDNKDKLLKLGFSLAFLRHELHYIFDPDKMIKIYQIDYLFINAIKTTPYDLCNMKYRADLLKDMGFNIETLVEFGINGDHVEHMGLEVSEWKTSLGLTEKNYNRLNITPKNIQNLKWDPDTIKNCFKLNGNSNSESLISNYPTIDSLIDFKESKADTIDSIITTLQPPKTRKSDKKKR